MYLFRMTASDWIEIKKLSKSILCVLIVNCIRTNSKLAASIEWVHVLGVSVDIDLAGVKKVYYDILHLIGWWD